MNQSDAYRASYNVKNATLKSINELASKVKGNVKVQSRIDELKKKLEKKQLWTRENSVKVLGSIAAGKDMPTAARVSAIKELNAMHGFNEPTKHDHNVNVKTFSNMYDK
jgi:hypothetical protein